MLDVSTQLVEKIPIIDVDTHVVEPSDLWTSRLSSKWGDMVPHVEWDEDAQRGRLVPRRSARSHAVGGAAMAGWQRVPAVPSRAGATPIRRHGTPRCA